MRQHQTWWTFLSRACKSELRPTILSAMRTIAVLIWSCVWVQSCLVEVVLSLSLCLHQRVITSLSCLLCV